MLLNCKAVFFFFLPEMLTSALSLFSPHTPPPLTFEMQAGWFSRSACPPISHSALPVLADALSISPLPLPRSLWVFHCALVWSKTALWHRARRPGSRKHQTAQEQIGKRQTRRNRGTEVCTHMQERAACVRACGTICDKQMNKLKREEKGDDFVCTFSTSMKGRKVSLWSPFLYRSERGG